MVQIIASKDDKDDKDEHGRRGRQGTFLSTNSPFQGGAARNDNLRCFFTGSQMLVNLRLAGTPALPFAHVLARRSMRHRCWFTCGWRGRQPSHLRGLSGMRLAKIRQRLTSRRPL
jgi:hypothetical protein